VNTQLRASERAETRFLMLYSGRAFTNHVFVRLCAIEEGIQTVKTSDILESSD
jgi:hypothetical protein